MFVDGRSLLHRGRCASLLLHCSGPSRCWVLFSIYHNRSVHSEVTWRILLWNPVLQTTIFLVPVKCINVNRLLRGYWIFRHLRRIYLPYPPWRQSRQAVFWHFGDGCTHRYAPSTHKGHIVSTFRRCVCANHRYTEEICFEAGLWLDVEEARTRWLSFTSITNSEPNLRFLICSL